MLNEQNHIIYTLAAWNGMWYGLDRLSEESKVERDRIEEVLHAMKFKGMVEQRPIYSEVDGSICGSGYFISHKQKQIMKQQKNIQTIKHKRLKNYLRA